MKMARAFIASVPLALVLVAALVVPLAVIPGTFGFQGWPSARSEQVTERQVLLTPPTVAVVPVRTAPAHDARRSVASLPVQRPQPAAPRRSTTTSTVPVRTTAPSHAGGPGRDGAPASQQHQPAASTPPAQQQPASQPQPAPTTVANGDPPMLRETPAPQPVDPPPAPVVPVPVPQVVPAAPAPVPPAPHPGDCNHGQRADQHGSEPGPAHGAGYGSQPAR
jgi:hypothetical protein